MKIVLAEVSYLKECMKTIGNILSYGRIKFEKDMIQIIENDPANVAQIHFQLLSSCCVEYDVKEPVEISIDIGQLNGVLKNVDKNSLLQLTLEDNYLILTEKNLSTTRYKVPTVENEDKETKVPELSFDVTAKISLKEFRKSIEKVDIFAESAIFKGQSGILNIMGEGDVSSVDVEIKPDEKENIKVEKEAQSKYSVEYLNKFLKFNNSLVNDIVLKFGKDYPLEASYISVDKFVLKMILAPRIESD